MKDMRKSMLVAIGYLFGLLVLGFTGFQTWSLLYEIGDNHLVAALGLVLFEGSLLYWWYFFQNQAEGLSQMGLSLLVSVFGLALVGGSTALHLGAIETSVLGAGTPSRLVTLAAVVNLVAKFAMPLLHPEVMRDIYKKSMYGKVLKQTFDQFETKVKGISTSIADQVSSDWEAEFRQTFTTGNMNKPQLLTSNSAVYPFASEAGEVVCAGCGKSASDYQRTEAGEVVCAGCVAAYAPASHDDGRYPALSEWQRHSEPVVVDIEEVAADSAGVFQPSANGSG